MKCVPEQLIEILIKYGKELYVNDDDEPLHNDYYLNKLGVSEKTKEWIFTLSYDKIERFIKVLSEKKTILHPYDLQYPNYRYPFISSSPWFDPYSEKFYKWTKKLEDSFPVIKEELLNIYSDEEIFGFQKQPQTYIPRTGKWNVFYLYYWGEKFLENCNKCPKTAEIIGSILPALNAPGGIYFSALSENASVLPHCDPINLRLRYHLGMVIPDGDCGIRVGEESKVWQEGKCLLFDDSFEHVTWNNEKRTRIVFIVDMWHPNLTAEEIELFQDLFINSEIGSPLYEYLKKHNGKISANISNNPTSKWWEL